MCGDLGRDVLSVGLPKECSHLLYIYINNSKISIYIRFSREYIPHSFKALVGTHKKYVYIYIYIDVYTYITEIIDVVMGLYIYAFVEP